MQNVDISQVSSKAMIAELSSRGRQKGEEGIALAVEHHRPELCPVSNKAWGALPSAAKSRGWITRFGSRPACSPKTHGHFVATYSRA